MQHSPTLPRRSASRTRWWVGARALGACALALTAAACADSDPPLPPPPVVVDLAGLERALAQRDHPLLVNFWATWCRPCVDEIPELGDVGRQFASDGLEVVAVSLDLARGPSETDDHDHDHEGSDPAAVHARTIESILGFVRRRGFAHTLFVYEDELMELDRVWQLGGAIPVTLAFDAAGRLVDRHDGRGDQARFEALARAALGVD